MIKPEEALLLFGKWKEEISPLRVVAWLASGHLSLERCFVRNFDSEVIALDLPDGSGAEIGIVGFGFEYGEPPEGKGEGSVRTVVAVRPGPKPRERILFIELAR